MLDFFVPSLQTLCDLLFILQNCSCCQSIPCGMYHICPFLDTFTFKMISGFFSNPNDTSFLTRTLNILIGFVLNSHDGVINSLKRLKIKHLHTVN